MGISRWVGKVGGHFGGARIGRSPAVVCPLMEVEVEDGVVGVSGHSMVSWDRGLVWCGVVWCSVVCFSKNENGGRRVGGVE